MSLQGLLNRQLTISINLYYFVNKQALLSHTNFSVEKMWQKIYFPYTLAGNVLSILTLSNYFSFKFQFQQWSDEKLLQKHKLLLYANYEMLQPFHTKSVSLYINTK